MQYSRDNIKWRNEISEYIHIHKPRLEIFNIMKATCCKYLIRDFMVQLLTFLVLNIMELYIQTY